MYVIPFLHNTSRPQISNLKDIRNETTYFLLLFISAIVDNQLREKYNKNVLNIGKILFLQSLRHEDNNLFNKSENDVHMQDLITIL